jgi:multidrug resistance efflux pump
MQFSSISMHSGEWVIPGKLILVVADLEHLHIETTYLSERDILKIQVGQAVSVLIKALNLDLTGKVTEIAPLADSLGGDVVYKTTIELDSIPPGLRAGMSVNVMFQ